jgi:hypothetical protein
MSDVANVRRVLGAGRLTARHSALFVTPKELRSVETKTSVAAVTAYTSLTWLHTAHVSAYHTFPATAVTHEAYVSATHTITSTAPLVDLDGAGFTLDRSRLGIVGLADAAGYEFTLDQSPLAPISDALLDADGNPYILDESRLA